MTRLLCAILVSLSCFAHAREAVVAKRFMVAAAHPLAVEAGYEMLKRGGSTVDAAIAVQAMLGLVEPESSGIGGGAFLLHWSERDKKLRSYDGRETAPAAARPERFVQPDGKPMAFMQAVVGGRSVGVPGVLRMLELAHRRHGRLAWAELFAPAIRAAEAGFEPSARLRRALGDERYLREDAAAREIFYSGGERIRNPDYAATLRIIAVQGAQAFYEGAIASDIVRAAAARGGDLTEKDLASYRAVEREPVCGRYRVWRICSMAPPSSGGVAVLQILGMLERTRFGAAAPQSADALHYFSEAGRLAYADRGRYLGDPDFVAVPVAKLLNPGYLDERAKLITEKSLGRALPGDMESGTSHMSIVEAGGDAVSMTTTIESLFGSRVMVRGFLLNNELTDFDFVPGSANALAAGKRPRSSMAPAMVFARDELRLVIGSPGGSAIINYVAKTLVGVLDWGLDVQAAIDLPNFGSRNGPTQIEQGSAYEALAPALAARGHEVEKVPFPSGLHGIERVPGGWRGGADSAGMGLRRAIEGGRIGQGVALKAKKGSLGKTTRPSLAGVLPRERLFELLDRGRETPVIWIAGPPGCGKTTLAASYLDRAEIPSLWYQLDEGDADVATFFYYLGLAADELEGAEGQPLPVLGPEYHAGLPVFARRYFQALYARLKPPFAVVFDGYHEIPASSGLHEVMRIALSELPRDGCALIVSRGDPPAALARLRANRTLGTLGWDELRLTPEETARLARERHPGLAAAALEELYARTQGWAAGLVLVLEQAKHGALADAPDASTTQVVFDYLAGEIFQKTDAARQDFLLRTACLPQMSAAMAGALTGQERAGEILAGLHRDNFFVALRPARPEPLYQYHPMFREFLLARAQEALPKELRRQLQRSAAAALEAAGRVDDALLLYRDSHDWDDMARLIEAQGEAMLAQGRGETLRHWVEDLPPELLHRYPWAVYWAAASQAQIAPREARLHYECAFELFRARGAEGADGAIVAASGVMDAILYELDDLSLLDRWIGVLDQAAAQGARFASPRVEAHVASSMVFALTLRQPQRQDIEQWVRRALGAAQHDDDPNLQIYVASLCALTLMWTGLYPRAQQLLDAARRLAASPGVSPFSRITLKNVESMHGMLTAQYAPALEAMREGLEIARATGVQTWTFQLLVHGYGAALGAGDLATAAKLAKELEAEGGAGRLSLCFLRHFQAWEAMLRKDLMRALQLEKTALRMAVEVGCPYFEVLCRLALAQVLLECGDQRKCIAQLRRMRAVAREIPNRHLEFACLLGFADMALAHGRPRPGLKALRLGLEIGRQYGYQHFLWWWPPAISRVCARALEEGIETDYVRALIRDRVLAPEGAVVESWPWMFRVRTLGTFHLERHGEPLGGSAGKAQRRPLELLKFLIAQGGEKVSEARVTDALWPRIDGDSAHRSFTSALHRLRKLLGEDKAVVLHEGKLTLDRRYFWIDAWAFEALAARVEATADPAALEKLAERMLALYRAPFMAGDVDAAWVLQPRERMCARLARAMGRVMRHWRESGQRSRALDCYQACVEVDPAAAEQASFKQSVTHL